MQSPLIFLVKTLSELYLLCFLLRIILQSVRADFYNPFSQFIIRVTDPLVLPTRRIVPHTRKLDVPALVVLIILQMLATWLILAVAGVGVAPNQFIYVVALRLISLTLWLYTITIFAYVILSWIAQAHYSPIAMILGQIVGPVLRPVRRVIPPIAGLDLSPLIVLILIQALSIALPLSPLLR
jgi:YggT family protein